MDPDKQVGTKRKNALRYGLTYEYSAKLLPKEASPLRSRHLCDARKMASRTRVLVQLRVSYVRAY